MQSLGSSMNMRSTCSRVRPEAGNGVSKCLKGQFRDEKSGLERQLTFNAEDIGEWNEREANDAPDPEEVAADVIKTDGCDHDYNELSMMSAYV